MKLLELVLRNFGPFIDVEPIDLRGGDRGLHLIHGPNEAGKSTALRAIRTLLFGFGTKTGDKHDREYSALRVGGTFRNESGAEISVMRRKSDVNSLRDAYDQEVLAANALAPFLGGLDRDRFNELFAMDHAELVAGGRNIVEGKGNLGSILFAASAGLARLHQVRAGLDAEIKQLFTAQGKNPKVNQAHQEWKSARTEVERLSLKTQDWLELEADLAAAQARRRSVETERRRIAVEKERLDRIQRALPVIARLAETRGQLALLEGVAILEPGFAKRREIAERNHAFGQHEADQAAPLIAEADRVLEELGPPALVLLEVSEISRLHGNLALHKQTRADRVAELAQATSLQAVISTLDAALGSNVERIEISEAYRERLQRHQETITGLETRADLARDAVEQASRDGLEPLLADPDLLENAQALDAAIQRIADEGDLEAQLARAKLAHAQLEDEAEVLRHALPLWSGSLADLERLPCPPLEAIQRFQKDFQDSRDEVSRIETAKHQHRDELFKLQAELEQDQLTGSVPSEAELEARRSGRDAAWTRVRRVWLHAEHEANPSALAEAVERGIAESDDLADRLRREAERVARRAQLETNRRLTQANLQVSTEDLATAQARRAQLEQSWVDLWKPTNLSPLHPEAMKDWLTLHRADLLRQAREIRTSQLELEAKTREIEGYSEEICQHLIKLGQPPDALSLSLPALLDRARATVGRAREVATLREARAALIRAEDELREARARWAKEVEPLGLGLDDSPAVALRVLLQVEERNEKLRALEKARARIAGWDQVLEQFETDVKGLVARVAPELAEAPVETALLELVKRLEAGQAADRQRKAATDDRTKAEARRQAARTKVDEASVELQLLLREARVTNVEELHDAQERSDEFQRLQEKLRDQEDQLAKLAGATAVDAFQREVERQDPQTLAEMIDNLKNQQNTLDDELRVLNEQIGKFTHQISAMDGKSQAADAAQRVEEHYARLSGHVEDYARLKLAAAVLREAIENHRKAHQTPVLDHAGELFARLTGGSFGKLLADQNDKGEPILRASRDESSDPLGVEAMSDGTVDQLYLALRLASLEAHLASHEPMPLVLDDLLVNFDDRRARAALEVLGEFSRKTQVLFFTHHEHLIDLARQALTPDTLFVHHLDRTRKSTAPPAAKPRKGRPPRAAT